MVAGWACSTGTHRDQFYGTDVGVGWIPGDASALMPRDASAGDAAALDGALDAVDALDATTGTADSAGAVDAVTTVDAGTGDTH